MAPARTTKSGEANLRSIAARGVARCITSRPAPMSSHSFQLTKEPKLFVPVGLVFPVTGSQEVIGDKISYFPAQPFSSGEVEAEMLSSEDTAQRRFFGGGRKPRKRTF